MKCFHCGQEIQSGAERCPYCGAYQGAGATVVLDQMYNPYAAAPESGSTAPLHPNGQGNWYAKEHKAPAVQFKTDRGLLKLILLSILTLGIYGMVVWCQMITELNVAACRYDGKRTMPFFAVNMLVPVTFGIAAFVWNHKLANRLGAELARRGIDYKISASSFWLWNVLGSLILIGPFVYTHKVLKAMNLINSDFNQNG